MEKHFDFTQVGKRMPYEVPEGFFDQLENNVMDRLAQSADQQEHHEEQPKGHPRKARTVKWVFRAALAAAAAVSLFVVFSGPQSSDSTPADSFANVELAYNNLSTEDQEYLMEVYEEDLFINETEEQ